MKLVILDRDGVINHDSPHYIKSPEEWVPIPGSLEAIAKLKRAGYHIAVATNQSGIARGYYDLSTLERIHQKMHDALAMLGGKIDTLVFCPHAPDEGCQCRKPAPGLLLEIAKKLQVDLHGVPFIGDSLKDVQAARAVGCRPILVRTSYDDRDQFFDELKDVPVYADLAAAVADLADL